MRRVATHISWRHAIALVATLLALPLGSLSAAESAGGFPYVAYIIEPDTYVRSGPGNQHYPTGQLPAGYAVEVYRHDGEGWCAIRPPEGSFSLAPSHQVRIIDGHTAEVTSAGVVARVGSAVGNQRNAVQVLLERGEVVQVAEPPKPGDAWVKIAPPAGEFRWLAARRLSRSPPVEAAPNGGRSTPGAGGAITVDPGDSFGHLLRAPATLLNSPPTVGDNTAWLPKAVAIGKPLAMPPGGAEELEIVTGSPASVQLTQYNQPLAGSPGDGAQASTGQARVRFEGFSADAPITERVADLQLRLSQIVVQPPVNWQLSGLREEAAALLAQEQSPEIREQLRDLLDRVVTFESVQSRSRVGQQIVTPRVAAGAPAALPLVAGDAAAATGAGQSAEQRGLTGNSANVLARVRSDLGINDGVAPTPGVQPPAELIAAANAPSDEPLYDAVGTLKPVVSRRQQAPRFALIDDHGDVVTFVTASADVNLQPYIGKRIGVRGSRGFMPEFRRAHVTASRITPLEEKLVK